LIPRDGPASSDESLKDVDLTEKVRELVVEDPKKLEKFQEMRVVMIQTAMGLKPPSGGFRGNYATLFALQKHGHQTMQFCWAHLSDINIATAELKEIGVWHDKYIKYGVVKMLDEHGEKVETKWWKFINVHGVLCVCLDADVMRYAYNNYLQQLDAATWIEVYRLRSNATLTDLFRQMKSQREP
jgi:hypothetical protein